MSVKAFEILSVAENISIKIQSIEASGNDLFLGSNESTLLRFLIEERIDSKTEQAIYSSKLLCQKNLGTKKSIQQIKAASALEKLLVLSDGNLFLLDLTTLQTVGSGAKIKNVLVFCINENPNNADPFTLQFCVGKRKSLQLCTLHEDRISLCHEISVQDSPINLVMDGCYVCVASAHQYSVYNVETGSCQDLFPCDSALAYPHMKRISKEEFLVMAPGNLGMFVTSAGTSERPPIQWSEGLLAFSYYHPYVVTMTSSFLKVYSLIDLQLKQTIIFNGGIALGNFDGQLYISTENSIHCLMPQPWTSQVMALLENGSIDEAIEMTEHSRGAGMTEEKYSRFTRHVLQRSGFAKMALGDFQEAQEFFLNGKLDIRELLNLFPCLLPSNCDFLRVQPPLHPFVDINQVFQEERDKVAQATQFVFAFLLSIRSSPDFLAQRWEIDTAIIKMYSNEKSSEILDFLDCGNIDCCLEECANALERQQMYAALSKLYRSVGESQKAVKILTRLLREELKDESFRGVTDIVDLLIECGDEKLLWQYKDVVLEADETEGLRMFCGTKLDLDHNKVLKCLLSFPKSRIKYLNHLINIKKSDDEKLHTELVLHYINEQIQKGSESSEELSENRWYLQNLLRNSEKYNLKTVLARVHGTHLLFETATVYGKMGQHEKALAMLVYEVQDVAAAEEFCVQYTTNLTSKDKSNIFATLLKIYLSPPPGSSPDDILLAPALDMLSRHSSELDLNQVLDILPSEWSVTIISQYLKGALRNSMSQARATRLHQSLLKINSFQMQSTLREYYKSVGPIQLTSNSICCACEKSLKSSAFSLFPNGVLTHVECAKNPSVCPLTGQIFKIKSDKSVTDSR